MPSDGERLQVELCWATEDATGVRVQLDLQAGSTIADALEAMRSRAMPPYLPLEHDGYGIWSVRCDPETRLQPGDRIEIYQPLVADPKIARHRRVEAQRRVLKPGR